MRKRIPWGSFIWATVLGFALAFFATEATRPACSYPVWIGELNSIRHRNARIESYELLIKQSSNDDRVVPESIYNKWFARTLTATESKPYSNVVTYLDEKPELDSWQQPYRFVRDRTLPDGRIVERGIYSTGYDRKSNTEGNDPDDINSWDPNSGEFYRRRERVSDLIAFGLLWLMCFGGSFIIVAGIRDIRSRGSLKL